MTANQGEEDDGTVSVLLNSGDGSFGAKRDYVTGGGSESLGLGDLNGDGKPDLVTADGQAEVLSVLLNIGDGRFGAKRDYRTGEEPSSVAIGDVNGDSKPDIATANNGDYTVSVFANRGDGTFRPKRNYPTGYAPVSIALGDLRATREAGPRDCGTEAPRSPCRRQGGSRFKANIDYRTRPFPTSVAIGVWTAAALDLAAANIASRSVSVLYNKPGLCRCKTSCSGNRRSRADDRARPARREDPRRLSNFTKGLLQSHKNQTRHPCCRAAAGRQPRRQPWRKRSWGAPCCCTLLVLGASTGVAALSAASAPSFAAAKRYATASRPWSVAIGDLNGDGRPDLAIVNDLDSTVSVLLNRGDGRFQARVDYATGHSTYESVAIGDLNGDGRPDLVTAGSDVSVL